MHALRIGVRSTSQQATIRIVQMTIPSAAYLRRRSWRVVFVFGACLMISGGAAARSDPRYTKRPTAAVLNQINPVAFLIHGNFCGIGSRPKTKPIDALDIACMHHDACAPIGGIAQCGCTARLKHEAEAVAQNPAQPPEIQLLASATAAVAALSPCMTSR